MITYYQTQMAVKAQKQVKKVNKKVDSNKFVNQAEKKGGINAPTNYYRHFDMKRFWIIFGVTAGIFVLLLILSSTVDFQVSWGLAESKFAGMYAEGGTVHYYSTNGWDNLVESFGESLGFLVCTFGLWLMAFPFFFVDKNKKVWYRLTSQIIIPTFLIFTAVYVMYYYNNILGLHSYLKTVGGNTKDEVNRWASALFSIIFNLVIFGFIFMFKRTTRISLAKLGFLMVMAFIFSEIFVWILKYQADLNRERFRAIMCDPDCWVNGVVDKAKAESYFHWWWEKTPISVKEAWEAAVPSLAKQSGNAFSSFPSGHSSLAACTLTLCFLPCCCEKAGNKQWKGYFIWLLTLGVTLTVMFSRVSAGAHWLSDTTIGFFFGSVPSLILGLIIFKLPKVSDYFQNMNINGKWFQFVIFPVILPVVVWLITNVLPWA
mgnify:CR=1 FL=1